MIIEVKSEIAVTYKNIFLQKLIACFNTDIEFRKRETRYESENSAQGK